MKHLLLATALLFVPAAAFAQSAPAYEFLTLIESESRNDNEAKLLFAPDFQGKTEVKLITLDRVVPLKDAAAYRRNQQVVNEYLTAASIAGWELVSCITPSQIVIGGSETRYLFRRIKR